MTNRISVYKQTDDDWHGNYKIADDARVCSLVNVQFCLTGPSPPVKGDWRVCVWGNDDMGMEMDFKNEVDALNMFMKVIGLEKVNMSLLKKFGFVNA